MTLQHQQTITEVDKAYIAGLLDGEGNIHISHCGSNKRGSMYAVVSNTNREVLEWCKERYTGSIRTQKKKENTQKTLFQWQTTSRKALHLLQDILPYLHIKREQATTAIEFQKTLSSNNFSIVPHHIRLKRLQLETKLRLLNYRGPTKNVPTSKYYLKLQKELLPQTSIV